MTENDTTGSETRFRKSSDRTSWATILPDAIKAFSSSALHSEKDFQVWSNHTKLDPCMLSIFRVRCN